MVNLFIMESFVSQSSVNQIVLLIVFFFLHVSQYSVLVKYMQMFMTVFLQKFLTCMYIH